MDAFQIDAAKAAAVLHLVFPAATVALAATLPILRVLTQGPSTRATYRVASKHRWWLRLLSPVNVGAFVSSTPLPSSLRRHGELMCLQIGQAVICSLTRDVKTDAAVPSEVVSQMHSQCT
jgi:hypothetical protein